MMTMEFNIQNIKLNLARDIECKARAYLLVRPESSRIALGRKNYNKLIDKAQKRVNSDARKKDSKPVKVSGLFGYFGDSRVTFYMVNDE